MKFFALVLSLFFLGSVLRADCHQSARRTEPKINRRAYPKQWTWTSVVEKNTINDLAGINGGRDRAGRNAQKRDIPPELVQRMGEREAIIEDFLKPDATYGPIQQLGCRLIVEEADEREDGQRSSLSGKLFTCWRENAKDHSSRQASPRHRCLNGLKYFKPFKPTEPIDPALHLSRRLGVCLERLTGIDTDGAGVDCGARGTERASGMSLKCPNRLNCHSCKLPLRAATVHQLGSDYEAKARRPGCGVEALSMREFLAVEVRFLVGAKLTCVQHGVWRASGEK
ncbi:hypothetical protein DFH09DRAFT_1088866 [Mycena vulgaris]|nr:hypothetical protein DFH09DRAFT_1088866 [Mycena vulgaris]